MQVLSPLELRHLAQTETIDGIVVAPDVNVDKQTVTRFKLMGMPPLGVVYQYGTDYAINWLGNDKSYIDYLETNLIDNCNLNCKHCTHFANLFEEESVYDPEQYKEDLEILATRADLKCFRLLGGEPLLLKNLGEYVRHARACFPGTDLHVVTNGLLVPSLPPETLEIFKECETWMDVSLYHPTRKMADKIVARLNSADVPYRLISMGGQGTIDYFGYFLTSTPNNDPAISMQRCFNNNCLFLRQGKLYKCPIDSLLYKVSDRFDLKYFPPSTPVDIRASNFSEMLSLLCTEAIELCRYCSEEPKYGAWQVENKPNLSDWLVG